MDDTLIQHDLYTFLIAPVTDTLPERLVIIPDAELTYIPFDLLKDDHGHMIIEQTTVSYAYQYGGPGPDTQSDEHPYEIYCLSPSYENTLETETLSEKSMLTSLPNAKAETDSIQQLFGKKAMLSSAKTDSQVFASLNSARIFHFSGHAIVEKNGAYLAMGNEAGQEYKLTMEELSLLANGPDLVVLSACETGLGKLETGEGIRSLGRSFAEAGAEAVLFTLWSVNDLSSAEIMILFYRHLLSGNDVDEALRNAKLEYLSTSGEVMQHPYYWAGFVATGEMGFYKN
jgi:CHAT domain-containing protein